MLKIVRFLHFPLHLFLSVSFYFLFFKPSFLTIKKKFHGPILIRKFAAIDGLLPKILQNDLLNCNYVANEIHKFDVNKLTGY